MLQESKNASHSLELLLFDMGIICSSNSRERSRVSASHH